MIYKGSPGKEIRPGTKLYSSVEKGIKSVKRILVVFAEIPETVSFHILEVPENQLDKVLSANDQYINASRDTEGIDYVYSLIIDEDKNTDVVDVIKENIDYVIQCGFVL